MTRPDPAASTPPTAAPQVRELSGPDAAHGCEELHLDSGVQRFPAHRLYLKFGFDIGAHYFSKALT